jgi:hypothetical protein
MFHLGGKLYIFTAGQSVAAQHMFRLIFRLETP